MTFILRPAPVLCAALLTLAACDEVTTTDPVARAELRGQKNCVAAVAKHTGIKGATLNTTIPVVEVNRHIVDVPGAEAPWMCVTDAEGKALEIVMMRG